MKKTNYHKLYKISFLEKIRLKSDAKKLFESGEAHCPSGDSSLKGIYEYMLSQYIPSNHQ